MDILVVDDEKDIRLLFEGSFRKEIKNKELSFHFVYSGEEAVDFIESGKADIVLIFSDINMPGMNGLTLLHYLKQKTQIPVIIITAFGNEKNYNKAMEYGADAFLHKPIDFNYLKELIKKVKKEK